MKHPLGNCVGNKCKVAVHQRNSPHQLANISTFSLRLFPLGFSRPHNKHSVLTLVEWLPIHRSLPKLGSGRGGVIPKGVLVYTRQIIYFEGL